MASGRRMLGGLNERGGPYLAVTGSTNAPTQGRRNNEAAATCRDRPGHRLGHVSSEYGRGRRDIYPWKTAPSGTSIRGIHSIIDDGDTTAPAEHTAAIPMQLTRSRSGHASVIDMCTRRSSSLS